MYNLFVYNNDKNYDIILQHHTKNTQDARQSHLQHDSNE